MASARRVMGVMYTEKFSTNILLIKNCFTGIYLIHLLIDDVREDSTDTED